MGVGNGRWLWATICEIEPGLYQAIYSNTGSAVEEEKLPRYATGNCASEAKRCFEHSVLEQNPITLAHSRPL
jgi:hypothetical protein